MKNLILIFTLLSASIASAQYCPKTDFGKEFVWDGTTVTITPTPTYVIDRTPHTYTSLYSGGDLDMINARFICDLYDSMVAIRDLLSDRQSFLLPGNPRIFTRVKGTSQYPNAFKTSFKRDTLWASSFQGSRAFVISSGGGLSFYQLGPNGYSTWEEALADAINDMR